MVFFLGLMVALSGSGPSLRGLEYGEVGKTFPKTAPYGTSLWRFCSASMAPQIFGKVFPTPPFGHCQYRQPKARNSVVRSLPANPAGYLPAESTPQPKSD